MNQRVSIGSGAFDQTLVPLGFMVVVSLGLFGYAAAVGAPYELPTVLCVGCVAIFLLRLRYLLRSRQWVTPTADGFVLENRHGVFEILDHQVAEFATRVSVHYSAGEAKSSRRRWRFAVQGHEPLTRVELHYDFPLDQPDPLGPLIERVLAGLTARWAASLAAGQTLAGKGWELGRAQLTLDDRSLPLDDVSAVDLVDGKVCVWVDDEMTPSVRIKAGSPNALVLARLLADRVRQSTRKRPQPDARLGRIIFERDKSIRWYVLLPTFVGVVAVGVVIGSRLGAETELLKILLYVAGYTVPAAAVLGYMLVHRVNIFRCHQEGVCHLTTGGKTRELRYEDVGAFTYSATRQYVKGAYVGTEVRMRFEPQAGVGGKPISYAATVENADGELDHLRDHVGRVIAADMLRRLRQGELVGWTDGLVFTLEGLELTRSGGLVRRAATRLIPYSDVAATQFHDGEFFLYEAGTKRAVFKTPISAKNFFPGYALLGLLRHASARAKHSDPEPVGEGSTSECGTR